MLPQQPVDLLDKPVTKKTTKLTAPAKEKVQKKMETPPTPRTKPVLQLETDPVPPQKDEKTTTEAIKVAKAEAGTKEASLVDAGAEGGDKGVTSGEVKGSGVKSEITDVLESGATSEGDVAGDGERGIASDAAVADVTNAGNGETKTSDDGLLKVEGSGEAQTLSNDALSGLDNSSVVATTDPTMPTNDTSPPAGNDSNELLIDTTGGLTDGNKSSPQGQIPSTSGVILGFESFKGADEVVGSTKSDSSWEDDVWS